MYIDPDKKYKKRSKAIIIAASWLSCAAVACVGMIVTKTSDPAWVMLIPIVITMIGW